MFAAVFPGNIQTIPHLAISIVRQNDAARFTKVFQSCCNVDAIT